MSVRTVSVALVAQVTSFVRGIGTAGGAVRQFGGELNALGRRSPERLNKITNAIGGAGLAMVALAGYAAKTAADFDKAMSHVDAVANSTKGELEQLRNAALNAGKTTSYTAIEAAKAEEELAKAGVSTSDILGGALTGSLSLASAGSLDLADAATIAAQAMNTFHLNGQNVGHIADVLSAGANKSAADVKQLGDALRQGGLVASQTGLTLEDTVGTLSAFADRALIGSDAGTSLKTMLQALANPSQQSAALMKQLGINAYDTRGQFIGITNLAQNLQAALGNLTQAQRNAALAQIFGSDATRSATVLYNLGAEGLQNYIDAVNDSGRGQRDRTQEAGQPGGRRRAAARLPRNPGHHQRLRRQHGSAYPNPGRHRPDQRVPRPTEATPGDRHHPRRGVRRRAGRGVGAREGPPVRRWSSWTPSRAWDPPARRPRSGCAGRREDRRHRGPGRVGDRCRDRWAPGDRAGRRQAVKPVEPTSTT
jgi:TP901 family phage tail tape measure protein